MSPSRSHLLRYLLYGFMLMGCAGLKVSALRGPPTVFIDTSAYTFLAELPFWSTAFFGGPRPFLLPLIYKLLANNFQAIVFFQGGFAILCWAALAMATANTVQSAWLKPVAFSVVLIFSLSTNIVMWDRNLLSESISISLLALFIATWLWLQVRWHWGKAFAFIAVAALWAFTRDANAYVVGGVAGIFVAWVFFRRAEKRYLWLAVAFAIIFTASQASLNHGKRWVFPFFNVLAQRVLISQQRTDYFAARGMPITPALMWRSGKWAYSDNEAFFKLPELGEFREWTYTKGKLTYTFFLLVHPGYLVSFPLREWQPMLAGDLPYAAPPFKPSLPAWLDNLVYFNAPKGFLVALLSLALLLSVARTVKKHAAVPLVLLMGAIPFFILIWHADAQEIARHSISAAILLRLSTWLLLLYLLDAVVQKLYLYAAADPHE